VAGGRGARPDDRARGDGRAGRDGYRAMIWLDPTEFQSEDPTTRN
jgi:hypothetical protein